MDETAQRSALNHARRLLGDPRAERQTSESLRRTELSDLAQSLIVQAKNGGAYLALVVDNMSRDLTLIKHEVVGQPATKRLALIAFVASMVAIGASFGACIVVGSVVSASLIKGSYEPAPTCVEPYNDSQTAE